MHEELLLKIVAMFSTGDISPADEVFLVTYLDHQKPEWIKEDGPEEFKKIVASARESLPNLVVNIVGGLIVEGDKVDARLSWISDNVERETLEILRIEDGKVAEHWGAEAWSKAKS
jgi:predicted SnoaL-like aldol condensation-catalyzing enzyme